MNSQYHKMKTRLKHLFYKTGTISLMHSLRNRDSLSVIMFHDVVIGSEESSSPSTWTINRKNFERCVDLFKRFYNVITLEELLMFMKGKIRRLPERSLLITFDDGLTGQAEVAAKILKSRKLPALFFLTVGHLALKQNTQYKVKLDTSKLLSEREIKNLADQGFSIGCHGLTHTPLTEIKNENYLKTELLLPPKILKAIIPNNIGLQTLSFPHSKHDEEILMCARQMGYKAIFAGGSRLNRISTLPSKKTIARIPIIEGMWIESSAHPSAEEFQVSNLAWWLVTLKYA